MAISSVTLTRGVAAGAFTFGANCVQNDTVTVGDVVYTYKDTPSSANDVDVGTDTDTSISNLVAAINDSGVEGTTYGTGTVANPYFTASADTANDELDLSARLLGDQVNGIRLAASGTGPTAAATCFSAISGGTDGAGSITAWVAALETSGQFNPNSALIQALHEVTEAAD